MRRLSLPSALPYRTGGEISLEMIIQNGTDVYSSYSGTLAKWVGMKASGGGFQKKEEIRIYPSYFLTLSLHFFIFFLETRAHTVY